MIRMAVVALAAAAAVIALNVVLLGRASGAGDPVGQLRPQLRQTHAAPAWTVRPARGPVHDGGADD